MKRPCKRALAEADGSALYTLLEEHGSFQIEIEGETVELSKDEVEVRLKAREGYAAASTGGRVVVLDTRVTDELRLEGLAREVVNRIQTARKTMNLPYEARIRVTYAAEGAVAEAIDARAAHIAGETLAKNLTAGPPEGRIFDVEIDGSDFRFGIEVVIS